MIHKGIDHILALVLYAVVVQKAVQESLAGDNKIDWRDTFKLWPAAKGAKQAFSDAKEVIPELADLDPVEAQQIVDAVKAEFSDKIADEHARDIAEAGLRCAPPLVDLYATIVKHYPKAALA